MIWITIYFNYILYISKSYQDKKKLTFFLKLCLWQKSVFISCNYINQKINYTFKVTMYLFIQKIDI